MCLQLSSYKQVISREQNLGQYITLIAKVLHVFLSTEIVKTIIPKLAGVNLPSAVAVYGFVAVLYEFERDIPCALDDESVFVVTYQSK